MSSSQQPSVTPHTERTFSVNNAVRTLFSALQDGAVLSQNSDSEIEDVPRAVLSVLQNKHTTGALRRESERGGVGGDQIFEKERETVMNLDLTNLIKGAVISVGGESPQSTGSDISAYKYSSLLRLALYLSAVPAEQLEILLPRLLKISEEWPKIILKAFSHLLSSSRATQDVSTSISFCSPDPELVQIVLQVRKVPQIFVYFHLSILTVFNLSY